MERAETVPWTQSVARACATLLVLVALPGALLPCRAQALTWSRSYDEEGGGVSRGDVVVTSEGYVLAAGLWSPETWRDIALLGISRAGDVVWARRYVGDGDDRAAGLCVLAGGGIVVAGDRRIGLDRAEGSVLRVDEHGAVVWHRSLVAPGRLALLRIRCTSDGGFVLVGVASRIGVEQESLWVGKLNGNGELVWQQAYWAGQAAFPYDILPLRAGGYLLVAEIESSAEDVDPWLLELREGGSVAWQRIYGADGKERLRAAVETGDGGIVLVGSTLPRLGRTPGPIPTRAWAVKLAPDGAITWQRAFGSEESQELATVHESVSGGTVVSGFNGYFGQQIWNAMLDRRGRIVWQRVFDGALGGILGLASAGTSDGGAVLSTSTVRCDESTPLWLLKLDRFGRMPGTGRDGVAIPAETHVQARDTAVIPFLAAIAPVSTEVVVQDVTQRIVQGDGPRLCPGHPVAGRIGPVGVVTIGGARPADERPVAAGTTASVDPAPVGEQAQQRGVQVAAAPAAGRVLFGQTILAAGPDRLVWSDPANVYFVKGTLDGLTRYQTFDSGFVEGASSLDISGDDPSPSVGYYYLVRSVARGSWQSSAGAEPRRDVTLP